MALARLLLVLEPFPQALLHIGHCVALLVLASATSFAVENRTTEQVWDHHIQSWEARDLTAIVSDYDADSVEFYGTDSFVIEDGVISVQTIASPLYDRFPVN